MLNIYQIAPPSFFVRVRGLVHQWYLVFSPTILALIGILLLYLYTGNHFLHSSWSKLGFKLGGVEHTHFYTNHTQCNLDSTLTISVFRPWSRPCTEVSVTNGSCHLNLPMYLHKQYYHASLYLFQFYYYHRFKYRLVTYQELPRGVENLRWNPRFSNQTGTRGCYYLEHEFFSPYMKYLLSNDLLCWEALWFGQQLFLHCRIHHFLSLHFLWTAKPVLVYNFSKW